jgi:hypothetical protein
MRLLGAASELMPSQPIPPVLHRDANRQIEVDDAATEHFLGTSVRQYGIQDLMVVPTERAHLHLLGLLVVKEATNLKHLSSARDSDQLQAKVVSSQPVQFLPAGRLRVSGANAAELLTKAALPEMLRSRSLPVGGSKPL